jgi:hypothetical protein
MHDYPEPPATAQELDAVIAKIDAGEGYFASLGDEQRDQMKTGLTEHWIAEYLDDYPVPSDRAVAVREYRAIESGAKYPHLPPNLTGDLLMRFDEVHGEGGPQHWAGYFTK